MGNGSLSVADGEPSISPNAASVADDAEHLDGWVLTFRTAGSLPPLFCACGGGGDIFDYRDLALALPQAQPVYVLGMPPLEPGESFPSVQRLAAIYVDEVRRRQPSGPYQLCGHSFGGLVVYEMAALLANDGERVGLVALLDALHPSFKRTMSRWQRLRFQSIYLVDRTTKYFRNLASGRLDRIMRDGFDYFRGKFKEVTFKVVRSVVGRLRQPVPGAISSDELILVSAWHRYEPGRYDGRLVLLTANDRPPEYNVDPTLGWDRCETGAIDVHVVPGDHYSFLHPPHVRAVVERMLPYLVRP